MDNKKVAIGVAIGVASAAACAAVAVVVKKTVDKVNKITTEMENDKNGCTYTSPEGNNAVTLTYASSETANGLTRIEVVSEKEGKEDTCKMVAYARKTPYLFESEWIDNDHFKLLIGCRTPKQCIDVSFVGDKIVAKYYLTKPAKKD